MNRNEPRSSLNSPTEERDEGIFNKQPYESVALTAFHRPQKSRNTPARVEQIVQDGLNGTPTMTHTNSAAALLESIRKAQKLNRIAFSGEHIFNVLREPVLHGMHRDAKMSLTQLGDNPTHIPDEVWNVLRPVIVIRHPVPHVTSGYAGVNGLGMGVGIDDEDLDILCSQRYFRYVYTYMRVSWSLYQTMNTTRRLVEMSNSVTDPTQTSLRPPPFTRSHAPRSRRGRPTVQYRAGQERTLRCSEPRSLSRLRAVVCHARGTATETPRDASVHDDVPCLYRYRETGEERREGLGCGIWKVAR